MKVEASPPPAAEKRVQHKFVERVVAARTPSCGPTAKIFCRREKTSSSWRCPLPVCVPRSPSRRMMRLACTCARAMWSITRRNWSELPFALRRKAAEQIRHARVSVRLVERVPKINAVLQRGDELADIIHKRRNRRRIRPAAGRVDPRRIGKMMQHDHRRDACCACSRSSKST